jgi:hypothetical protein
VFLRTFIKVGTLTLTRLIGTEKCRFDGLSLKKHLHNVGTFERRFYGCVVS